jgi:hypothetical protein
VEGTLRHHRLETHTHPSEREREGMNEVKILSSIRLLVQTTACPPRTSPAAAFITVLTHKFGAARTPAPSEQRHPQNSRFTPGCLSVVLWAPCSGVEWRVFEPTIRVWRSGNDGQAASEPGGGGCG